MQRPMVVPPNIFPGNNMVDAKAALRRRFRGARGVFVAGLAAGERERLEGDMAAIVAPLLAGHRILATYAAVGAEIDPRGVESTAHFQSSTDGVQRAAAPPTIAFPRVAGAAMAFHAAAWGDLAPRTLGIPEPGADTPQVVPTLLLVPLLAVTEIGIRLGQGGGYYDRMLNALRRAGDVTAIGLAWDIQVAGTLPRDPWDELLDWVATPTRLVDCRKGR